jgi:DNA-binding Lrp family transcriptional regulator
MRDVSEFVAQKLSTIDRVHSTATYFVLKTYKRDGDAFLEPEPDHRLPVVP